MKIEVIWFTKNRQGENLILNILYTWNQLWFYFYWKVGADTFELNCMHKFYLRHHYQIIFYPNLNSWSLEFPLQFKIGFEGQGIIWRYSNVSIPSEFSRDHSGLKMERHALEFGWLSVSSQTKINELVNGFGLHDGSPLPFHP